MPKVIIYTRVSTDEQADKGYSLRDQEARLRSYCHRNGLEVVRHFSDDHSAKTFERPAFKALRQFVKANPHSVDMLLVVKWDRFSRDATGALSMSRTLDEVGVQVQATDQPVDLSVPEQMMMLAIYVAAPEVENRRRSMATKAGMRRAMREGRYCNVPPKGYERSYDISGKMLIIPGEDAAFVREAFQQAAERPDLPMEEIRRVLRKRGFKCSKNQFTLMLRNVLYAGKIFLPAWRDEPAETVEGLHEAIISESTFRRVQARFDAPLGTGKKLKLSEPLVLRGHLLCTDCAGLLTGSRSKGRSRYYTYYHCHHCGGTRYQAGEANDAFADYLHRLEMSQEVQALYQHVLQDLTQTEEMQRRRRLTQLKKEITSLEEKLFRTDEAYIEERIPTDSYTCLKSGYEEQVQRLHIEKCQIEERSADFAEQLTVAVRLLSNLGRIWQRAPLRGKHDLLVRIFPDHLIYRDGSFRTSPASPIIALLGGKKAENKERRPLERGQRPMGLPG